MMLDTSAARSEQLASDAGKPFNLHVLTYNIHKGFNTGNTRFVLPHIRNALAAHDADVILLQEVTGEHSQRSKTVHGWPAESQCDFLAGDRWPYVVYGKNATYRAGHHGNAILSRYPLRECENINLSRNRYASRSLLHAVLDPPLGPPIHIICLHLGLREHIRQRQLSILAERVHSFIPSGAPVIIGGDFNDWRQRAEFFMEVVLGFRDVFKDVKGRHARTFPAAMPVFAVDRIYFRGVQALWCGCLRQAPWRGLSDHAPLSAVFSVADLARASLSTNAQHVMPSASAMA
jgi:endonuclease/exonuclease/phosphatase family metal-dependent hydrolase